jgi:DNA-binding MarR family transcriptional regulator
VEDRVSPEQAQGLAVRLGTLMRRLFAVDDDPAAELPLAQLRVCMMLVDGPQAMSALSRELRVSLSAMTQLADRLERSGMVKRVVEGSDRRVRQLQLTRHGERVLRCRHEARVQRVQAVLGNLSPQTRQEVSAALDTLLAACHASEEPAAAKEDSGIGAKELPAISYQLSARGVRAEAKS